jgi:hypothetical protein
MSWPFEFCVQSYFYFCCIFLDFVNIGSKYMLDSILKSILNRLICENNDKIWQKDIFSQMTDLK